MRKKAIIIINLKAECKIYKLSTTSDKKLWNSVVFQSADGKKASRRKRLQVSCNERCFTSNSLVRWTVISVPCGRKSSDGRVIPSSSLSLATSFLNNWTLWRNKTRTVKKNRNSSHRKCLHWCQFILVSGNGPVRKEGSGVHLSLTSVLLAALQLKRTGRPK